MKKKTLKHILSEMMIIAMMLNVTACGSKVVEANNTSSKSQEEIAEISDKITQEDDNKKEENSEKEDNKQEENSEKEEDKQEEKSGKEENKEQGQNEQEDNEQEEEQDRTEDEAIVTEDEEYAQDSVAQEMKAEKLTEDEYATEIDKLLKNEAVVPTDSELLSRMADCATCGRIIDYQGKLFSEMDERDKFTLRFEIMQGVLFGESSINEDISETVNGEMAIPLEAAKDIFKDFYGEENFTAYEYENADDEYYYPLLADGEAWEYVEHKQFFEDDDFVLVSGPGFYESNGGDEQFVGYADILFKKNPDSRYGVTLLYGRYRDGHISVEDVETTSELSGANGKNYSGINLVDGDYSTVWAEGVSGTGVGENIVLHLDKKQPVWGILICNGYTASYEQYTNNGLLTEASADFGNGNVVRQTFEEGYAGEDFSAEDIAESNRTKLELDEPVITDTIVITITGAKAGAKFDDTCLSEILVY